LIQEKIGKKFEFIFEERKVIPNKIWNGYFFWSFYSQPTSHQGFRRISVK
jgi:hypothetical protein